MGSFFTAGKWKWWKQVVRDWTYDQTKISCPDEENQNDENYSETVSSELHPTILSDIHINSKIRSLKYKKR